METNANLLTHTDARRYFKQSEIVLYRQTPEVAAAAQAQAQNQPQQITGAASDEPTIAPAQRQRQPQAVA
jgi:hypothetical protein